MTQKKVVDPDAPEAAGGGAPPVSKCNYVHRARARARRAGARGAGLALALATSCRSSSLGNIVDVGVVQQAKVALVLFV